jgi:hypothetical protein
MEIVDFAIQDWLQVEEYDIVGTAHAASIASSSGEAHVRVRMRPRTRQARPTPRSGSCAAQTAVGPDHHFRLYAIVR